MKTYKGYLIDLDGTMYKGTEKIEEAVEDYMSQDENVKNLVEMKTNENGKVTTIDFNSHGLRGMHSKITKQLHEKLKETETEEFNSSAKTPEGKNDGVIYNIPLGQATGNSLCSFYIGCSRSCSHSHRCFSIAGKCASGGTGFLS